MQKTVLYVALLFSFLLGKDSLAQSSLSGKIGLQDTQKPAFGAYAYLHELEQATSSDVNGAFTFGQLPAGVFTLEISYLGYQSVVRTVTIPANDDVRLQTIELEPRAYEVEGLVVTGGYLSAQDDNAIKIEKLDRKDLSGVAGHYLEALARLPGIERLSRGVGIGKPIIRGLTNNQVLVLNNGVRNENYQYGDNHPIGLDEWGVDRIEVIKGPASLLYGSGAIGGVVHLVRERPAVAGTLNGEIEGQYYSNTNGWSGTAALNAGGTHFFGGVRVGAKTHEDYVDGDGQFIANTRFNTLAVRAHTGYRSNKWVSKLYYDYDGQELGMFTPFTRNNITSSSRSIDVWYQDLENHLLNWQNTFVLPGAQLNIQTAWQHNHRQLVNPQQQPEQEALGATIDMSLDNFSYNAKLSLRPGGDYRLIAGIQGLHSYNQNVDDPPTIILPEGWMHDLGAYALLQRQFDSNLNLQLGLRYDIRQVETETTRAGELDAKPAVDENFSNVSASLGTTYYLNNNWLVRANFASGFRAPSLIELSANGIHGGRWEQGRADLQPERNYEFDLSTHFHGDYLTFELAGFYNRIQDYIYLQPTEENAPIGGGLIYAFEQDNAKLSGLEAGLHLHPAGMSWLHISSTAALLESKQDNGDRLPFAPAATWKNELGVQGQVTDWLTEAYARVLIDVTFDQNNPAPFEQETENYTLLGIQAGGTVYLGQQPVELKLVIQNLLDEAYFNHLSTLRAMNVQEQGRNAILSLRIPFSSK